MIHHLPWWAEPTLQTFNNTSAHQTPWGSNPPNRVWSPVRHRWIMGVYRHAGVGPRSFQSGDRRLTGDSAPSWRRIEIQTTWLRASAPATPPTCSRRFFTQAERRDPPDAKPLRCCRTHDTRIIRARVRAASLLDHHTSCRPTVSVLSGVALGLESNQRLHGYQPCALSSELPWSLYLHSVPLRCCSRNTRAPTLGRAARRQRHPHLETGQPPRSMHLLTSHSITRAPSPVRMEPEAQARGSGNRSPPREPLARASGSIGQQKNPEGRCLRGSRVKKQRERSRRTAALHPVHTSSAGPQIGPRPRDSRGYQRVRPAGPAS